MTVTDVSHIIIANKAANTNYITFITSFVKQNSLFEITNCNTAIYKNANRAIEIALVDCTSNIFSNQATDSNIKIIPMPMMFIVRLKINRYRTVNLAFADVALIIIAYKSTNSHHIAITISTPGARAGANIRIAANNAASK